MTKNRKNTPCNASRVENRKNENTPLFVWRKRPELLIAALDEWLEQHPQELAGNLKNEQVIRRLITLFEIVGVRNNARTISTSSMERYLRLYRQERRNKQE